MHWIFPKRRIAQPINESSNCTLDCPVDSPRTSALHPNDATHLCLLLLDEWQNSPRVELCV